MNSLFVRVYAKLILSFMTAGLLFSLIVMPRARVQVERNIEDTLAPTVALAVEMLAEHAGAGGDLDEALARAEAGFREPAKLVSRGEVSLEADQLARLDRGEILLVQDEFRTLVFAGIRGTERILKLGPINAVHPMGGARGASILLLFIGGLSIGVHLIVNPIRTRLSKLARAAEAVGRGDLGARAEAYAQDEIGSLSASFNGMASEIQRLVAEQEELLRMTSHELRTPLQRMHFNLEDLRDAGEGSARERELGRMERDLEELDSLIEELLSYVRLRGGGLPLSTPIEVGPILDELCETLSDRRGEISLVRRDAALDSLTVSVEVRLVRRAVANLIVNALRHARSRVEITVTREGQSIWINVDDDGPGVPAESRERIFEPFQRLDDERTRSTRGSGLGLAIVRRIAEIHGGGASVLTSDLGGARFRLSFPQGD